LRDREGFFGEDAEDVGPDVKTTAVSETVQDTHTANVAYFEQCDWEWSIYLLF